MRYDGIKEKKKIFELKMIEDGILQEKKNSV